jgi:hypothetical protein
MLRLFFVGFSISAVTSYYPASLNSRLEFSSNRVVVSDGLFNGLGDRVGGALYCKGSGELIVCDTTFRFGSASEDTFFGVKRNAYGGALVNDGNFLSVSRSCFRE